MTREPQFRDYLLDYNYQGASWGITIQATSFEDAKARAQALYYAKVLGTLEATIPASPGAGLLVRAMCWVRNWRGKNA